MKVSYIIIIILVVAVIALCICLAKSCGNKVESNSEEIVLSNIASRTSIRSYEDKAVEKDKVDKLLKAGMAAPSAANKQPWHFIVVDDKAQLKAIAKATPNARMAAEAPLAIVVCGDMDKAFEGTARGFWVQDASAATENILLAANGMGLGAVWTGTYPDKERCEAVQKVLQLPDNIIPLNTIVIGYPAESPEPKQKFNEANISYNMYGQNKDASVATQQETVGNPTFSEFDIKSNINVNPFNFFEGAGVILSAGDKTASNAMTIGWGGMGTLWGRNVVTVYVAPGRYTHEFMEKHNYFTVMTFKDKKVMEYMGSHTGRDGDKAKALGLHTLYTENGTPYYEEADMVIECRMLYGMPFDTAGFRNAIPKDFYEKRADAGIHSIYIGEVVKAIKK
ncbi:MAG: nitroreductase family protein [Prevotella sp.]|nr:nitroreductase family protein [Prevotella sp.]